MSLKFKVIYTYQTDQNANTPFEYFEQNGFLTSDVDKKCTNLSK